MSDLLDIARFTLSTWGQAQAEYYVQRIEDRCDSLALNPMLGRSCSHLHNGLRRLEHDKHVIFYQPDFRHSGNVFIARILHQSMAPDTQDFKL